MGSIDCANGVLKKGRIQYFLGYREGQVHQWSASEHGWCRRGVTRRTQAFQEILEGD
jgi:hypothetical protein